MMMFRPATSRRKRRVTKTVAASGVLVLAAVALAACGSGSSSDDSKSGSASETITIAANPNSQPFMFYKKGTTDFAGAEADLWKAVGKEVGLKVKFEAATLETTLTGVASGRYNAATTFTATPERRKIVAFIGYLASVPNWVTLRGGTSGISEDPTSPCGKKIGVAPGSTDILVADQVDDVCKKAGLPAIKRVEFKEKPAAALAVKSNRVDAAIYDLTGFAAMNKEAGDVYDGPKVGGIPGLPASGSAIEKDDAALQKKVMKGWAAIYKSGLYADVMKKNDLETMLMEPVFIPAEG